MDQAIGLIFKGNAGQFSDNDHLYLPTIKVNEQQLDSSVYTVEHGRVQHARHMHPVKAGASTRERLRGRSLHAYWNTGSRALSCNIGSQWNLRDPALGDPHTMWHA